MSDKKGSLTPLRFFAGDARRRFVVLLESGALIVDDDETFFGIFRTAIHFCGLTPGEIADRLGVTIPVILTWAAGNFAPPVFVRLSAVQGLHFLLVDLLNEVVPINPLEIPIGKPGEFSGVGTATIVSFRNPSKA